VPEPVKPKILVVEDDPNSLKMLVRILTDRNFEAIPIDRSLTALESLENFRDIDLVLSDWMMPEIDGVELCSRIKKKPGFQSIYFILLTSRELTEDKVTALNAGVDDYLTKPYHQDELVARIRAGLRIRVLQKELLAMEKDMAIIQLAATAAHEINNPLTGIIGYLDLFKESLQSGDSKEQLLGYLERMSKQAFRIKDIVSKLSSLKEVRTKPYLDRMQIIDLHRED